MARLLIDTSVLVELERGGSNVTRAWNETDDVAIAAVTAAELLEGVEHADRRHREVRSKWVEQLLQLFSIEPYNLPIARVHARLLADRRRSGRGPGLHDLMIAATAIARDRVLVTTDLKELTHVKGLRVSGRRLRK